MNVYVRVFKRILFGHVRRPRGPMDKASAYGAGVCRFESYRGQSLIRGKGADDETQWVLAKGDIKA